MRTLLVLVLAWSTAHAVQLRGGGKAETDCLLALELGPAAVVDPPKTPKAWECRDGAPCDRDGACNGSCRLQVRLCANQSGDAACVPPGSRFPATVRAAAESLRSTTTVGAARAVRRAPPARGGCPTRAIRTSWCAAT